jgi:hypothetical protein
LTEAQIGEMVCRRGYRHDDAKAICRRSPPASALRNWQARLEKEQTWRTAVTPQG